MSLKVAHVKINTNGRKPVHSEEIEEAKEEHANSSHKGSQIQTPNHFAVRQQH